MIETYTLVTSTYSYDVKYDQTDPTRFFMYVGNPHKYPCVGLVIYPLDNKIDLNGATHSPDCAVGGNMHTGLAGTSHMLKVAIKHVMSLFPHIDRIDLTDNSQFICDVGTRSQMDVSMPDHNLLLYGKTMYQRRFGAKATDRDISNAVHRAHQFLKQTVTILAEDIGVAVEGKLSWHKLFQQISEDSGCGYFTKPRMRQLQRIFSLPTLMFTDWYIPAKTVRTWDVDWQVQHRRMHRMRGGGLAPPRWNELPYSMAQ